MKWSQYVHVLDAGWHSISDHVLCTIYISPLLLPYVLQMSFSFTLNIYTFFVPLFHLTFLPFLIFFFLPSLLLPPSSPPPLPPSPSQDLLQLQYEGLAIMKMFERAKINVNLLIYLINKKFYGRV